MQPQSPLIVYLPCTFQVVGDGHGFTQSGGVAFGTGSQLKANGASILGGLGNTASGQYSVITGGNGNALKVSDFAYTYSYFGQQLGLKCQLNFVIMDGSVAYLINTAFDTGIVPTILCRNSSNRTLTYTASPPLSAILGGSVALSSTTGIISGTIGPTAKDKTFVGITILEKETGLAGYLGFYLSVSKGELSQRI